MSLDAKRISYWGLSPHQVPQWEKRNYYIRVFIHNLTVIIQTQHPLNKLSSATGTQIQCWKSEKERERERERERETDRQTDRQRRDEKKEERIIACRYDNIQLIICRLHVISGNPRVLRYSSNCSHSLSSLNCLTCPWQWHDLLQPASATSHSASFLTSSCDVESVRGRVLCPVISRCQPHSTGDAVFVDRSAASEPGYGVEMDKWQLYFKTHELKTHNFDIEMSQIDAEIDRNWQIFQGILQKKGTIPLWLDCMTINKTS